MRKHRINRAELSQFNGKNGTRTYIAYQGRVYDVTGSFHWQNGKHWVTHYAGQDLTAELSEAPHGADMLGRFPIVGNLSEGDDEG
jgi:predicted heme/steroid binding protein